MLGETGSNLLKCPAFCLRDFEVCEYEETQQQDSEDDKNVWTTEELCEREREGEMINLPQNTNCEMVEQLK